MAKLKRKFLCQQCGATHPQWNGKCNDCGAWNSLVEEIAPTATNRHAGYAAAANAEIKLLCDVPAAEETRMLTGLSELDRVLGQGLVTGSVVLIGGDPGIGKSTLLLQTICHMSAKHKTLYVTGEESLQQVSLRAKRLSLPDRHLRLLAETQIESIMALAQEEKPEIIVIDSIQTMFTAELSSAPGSVSQVRESAAQLVRFAKQTNTALFLVGHVTKEGALAGPRVLEHMVDTVLYFEGEKDNRFRVVRTIKNRFGAVNEIGIFAMTEQGLKVVSNPSAIFLSRFSENVPGSVVLVAWEGTRPLLVEVQALVDQSHMSNPKRVTVGVDHSRLSMLLAVLHRHGGIVTYDQDVFVNIVGGVRVAETAADLALLFAIVSSLRNRSLPTDLLVFGEVGLAGEIRPIQRGQDRLQEAAKHGFKKAIVPLQNQPKQAPKGLEVIPVQYLHQALSLI